MISLYLFGAITLVGGYLLGRLHQLDHDTRPRKLPTDGPSRRSLAAKLHESGAVTSYADLDRPTVVRRALGWEQRR